MMSPLLILAIVITAAGGFAAIFRFELLAFRRNEKWEAAVRYPADGPASHSIAGPVRQGRCLRIYGDESGRMGLCIAAPLATAKVADGPGRLEFLTDKKAHVAGPARVAVEGSVLLLYYAKFDTLPVLLGALAHAERHIDIWFTYPGEKRARHMRVRATGLSAPLLDLIAAVKKGHGAMSPAAGEAEIPLELLMSSEIVATDEDDRPTVH